MPDYEKLTVIKLRDELVARGLSKVGLKAALIQRLVEADAQTKKSESIANEPPERDQEVDPVTRAATWVHQALLEPEGNSHLAEGTLPSRTQDEGTLKSAAIEDGPTLHKSDDVERAQYHMGQEEQAPDGLADSSSHVPIANGTVTGNWSENQKKDTKEPELQATTATQKQIAEVQAVEDKVETSTQPLLTGDEFLEDSRKRKRRSQSPPPSSVENTQKKLKVNIGRPLVQLPEDTTADSTKKEETPNDKLSQSDLTYTKESVTQNNGITRTNGSGKPAGNSPSAIIGQPNAESIPLRQTQSSVFQDLNQTNEGNAMPIHVKSVGSSMKSSPSDTRFKNLFTAPVDLEHASQQSHHPDAEEKPVNPALHPATSALYIRELMRPLKLDSLRDHLIALATPPDNAADPNIVTDFFLDSIRTHCFVGFENISAASRVRSGLHDRVWPNERDRRRLWVDFVPEEKLRIWIDVERTAGNGRGQPSKRWEVVYEDERNGITASLQEVGSKSGGFRAVKRSRLDANQGLQVTGPRISGVESRNIHLKSDGGTGFQALDDLFTSTMAKPKLYYLPVLKAEADQRLAKLAAGRGGGRGDEMRRFSFEEGSIVDNGPEYGRGGGYGRGGSYLGSYRGRARGYRLDASRGDSWRERRSGY